MVTKKIYLGGSLASVLAILIYLSTLQGVTITTSPDISCSGTINQPCISYFNITSNYYTLKFFNNSNQKLSFSPEVKDYKIYRYVSKKWTEIKFPINMTKGVVYQFKIVGIKFKTSDTVKWGIQVGDNNLDPYWYGTSSLMVEMPHQIIYSTEDTTTDSNLPNSFWNNNYTLISGGYIQTTPLVNTSLSTWIGTLYMFRPTSYVTGYGTNTNPTYAYDGPSNDTSTYAETRGNTVEVGTITYIFNVSSNISTTIFYSFNGTSGGVQLYNYSSSDWDTIGVSSATLKINFTYLQPYYINSTGCIQLRITSAGTAAGAYTRLWDTYMVYQIAWTINPSRYSWYKFPLSGLSYFDTATLNLYQQPTLNNSYGYDCNTSYPCVTNLYYSSNQTWSNISWNTNPSYYSYSLVNKNLTSNNTWVNWTITNQLKSVLANITYMLRIPMININLKAMNFTKSNQANKPYILTEVTKYLINESSCVSNPQSLCYQNGTFTPKGQSNSQWIFNITSNTSTTLYGNWNQTLPSCMNHYLSIPSLFTPIWLNYTPYYNPNAYTEFLTGVNNIENCALITNTTYYYINNITVKLRNSVDSSPANRYGNATIKLRSYTNWTTPGNELASCFIKTLTDSESPYNCTFDGILMNTYSWVCINTTSYSHFVWNSTNVNDTDYMNVTYKTTGDWIDDGSTRRPYIVLTTYLPPAYNVSTTTNTNIGNLTANIPAYYFGFFTLNNCTPGNIINASLNFTVI